MTSRDSESRASMGPAAISSKVPGADTSIQKQRGPNPQTDYKRHFNRTKERFDVVTLEQTRKQGELDRASVKQAKLQEELEYLLDAIAGEKMQGDLLKEAMHMVPSASNNLYQQRYQADIDNIVDDEDDEAQSYLIESEAETTSKEKRQRAPTEDTDDELLKAAGVASKRVRKK